MKFSSKPFAFCLGVVFPLIAGVECRASAATPVAYIYVQTANGVVGYSASSTGALTSIAGSPFKTSGLMAGSTGYAFFSVGTSYIHSYSLASNGAIGGQLSQIDAQSYSGGNCGPAPDGSGATLDHTGKFLYNVLTNNDYNTGCVAFQTYSIGSGGVLTFHGDTQTGASETNGAPHVLVNEKFAYSNQDTGHSFGLMGFVRETNGDLNLINFTETDTVNPGNYYTVGSIAPDPTNHLAAAVYNGDSEPPSLASYTADSSGNLTSTNTNAQLPILAYDPVLSMSPSGTLLAAGGSPMNSGIQPSLQIFHFNGANPITLDKTLLSNVGINGISWDGSNHLYAISFYTNRLYVFTVTATAIEQAPGSPYTISAPNSLFVKPL
jgi:hypothetical protein